MQTEQDIRDMLEYEQKMLADAREADTQPLRIARHFGKCMALCEVLDEHDLYLTFVEHYKAWRARLDKEIK